MLSPETYLSTVFGASSSRDDQRLMARVALNVLFAPDRFPVDMSELFSLSEMQWLQTEGFLAYCAVKPNVYSSFDDIDAQMLLTLLNEQVGPGAHVEVEAA
jgi:hypothetical protein